MVGIWKLSIGCVRIEEKQRQRYSIAHPFSTPLNYLKIAMNEVKTFFLNCAKET